MSKDRLHFNSTGADQTYCSLTTLALATTTLLKTLLGVFLDPKNTFQQCEVSDEDVKYCPIRAPCWCLYNGGHLCVHKHH